MSPAVSESQDEATPLHVQKRDTSEAYHQFFEVLDKTDESYKCLLCKREYKGVSELRERMAGC